ncbi:CD99 antigen isoform X2 [Dipodomys spectabilis]|uniref:CD99 antigen isoform X2 n=1 Tax=Dipodomys spectabilis TaxID=105255 RepID=UPI001C53A9D0|nr:CD99 antigen isoform X2 [Dipodomys spectabilis]
MRAPPPLALSLLLLLLLPEGRFQKPTAAPKKPGDDFDLSDALDGGDEGRGGGGGGGGGGGDDFDLQDALGGGGFSDRDLTDGAGGAQEEGPAQGVVPGVVGAVLVAVAGAVSSFVAFQKKKLCFQQRGLRAPASSCSRQRLRPLP